MDIRQRSPTYHQPLALPLLSRPGGRAGGRADGQGEREGDERGDEREDEKDDEKKDEKEDEMEDERERAESLMSYGCRTKRASEIASSSRATAAGRFLHGAHLQTDLCLTAAPTHYSVRDRPIAALEGIVG